MRIRPMEEKVIGYDVREMWFKDKYDFRMGSKLVKGLSSDLWSTIFDWGRRDVVGKRREEVGLGMIELPPMSRVGINCPLWSDLTDMLNYLSPYRCAEGKLYWVVAITLRTEDLERESRDREQWPRDPEANPNSIQSDWVLVGYDLTTEWSENMITPKLLREDEADDVAELTRELSEYLLFPSIEKAAEFKMRWDTAFPECAPHLVYGIWRIEETRYRPR
jgi:hypothetical protein